MLSASAEQATGPAACPASCYFVSIAHIIIIGMPPHDIIIGIPAVIMDIMRSQHCVNISMVMPVMGFISQIMPPGVMVQFICDIIIGMGIMPLIMGIGIMAGIAVMFTLLLLVAALFRAIDAYGLIPSDLAINRGSGAFFTFLC